MHGSTVRYSDFYNMMSSFESAGESSCCMVAKGRAFMKQEPGSSEIDTNHCIDDRGLEINGFLVKIFCPTLFT